jgi:type I site-specific restriction-modification system R (restriction) subunit
MKTIYKRREEVALFIKGIRILVIEDKNPIRDEVIAFNGGSFIVNCKAL